MERRLALDVRQLEKSPNFRQGARLSWHWSRGGEPAGSIEIEVKPDQVVLEYRWRPDGGEYETTRYPIYFTETDCHYGESRTWFCCPFCGRRCAVVYHRGRMFACRECSKLACCRQAEDETSRTWRRQRKIERRLSGGAGEWYGWQKPKGMHQATFDRLRHQFQEGELRRDELLCLALMRLMPDLRPSWQA